MSVPPSAPLHFTFQSDTYRTGLKWWLGVPLVSHGCEAPVCPGCEAPVDIYGDHLLSCPRNNFSRRHNAVQEALASILTQCGQGFRKEARLPDSKDTDDHSRPGDLLLTAWQDGRDVAVDLTICHAWGSAEANSMPASRERALEHARSFLRRKEHAKRQRHGEACERVGWGFIPMAFGTWGGLGPEGSQLLGRLLRRVAGWVEPDMRERITVEGKGQVGVAITRQICLMLEGKNLL